MQYIANPYRGTRDFPAGAPAPSVAAGKVSDLLQHCPAHAATALHDCAALADAAGVATLHVKDERERMGLGSFKALGAAYVIANDAQAAGGATGQALAGRTYITASAGNHGLSVAAGAAVFGAKAVVHIAETVPESFAARLAEKGATVVRGGADYAESMTAAMASAEANGWTLLSDTSWGDYLETPHRLMEGYVQLGAETVAQIPQAPTHIFLQAGVGGMAGAIAAYARDAWGDTPVICVVEPVFAPAIIESIKAGRILYSDGPVSEMGRLDCKEPAAIAMAGLAHDADFFVTLTESDVLDQLPAFAANGLETSASGGAGLAAAMLAAGAFGMSGDSRVLCILSEGPA